LRNIKIIKTGLDVSKILEDLNANPEDWGNQRQVENAQSLLDRGYKDVNAGVLQLVMGGVTDPKDYVGDTEICIPTPAYHRHMAVFEILQDYFKGVSRCGFLSLPVGGTVGLHIDEGKYYLTRDRYHLSIQGKYRYFVGDESYDVEPGTLLWFNNKLPHGTENLGDEVRITFVFDVPHDPNNPQNKLAL
jgi:mannose-6-phosphate isomerase-like protein (cupin superfamily)